jgi:PAS domain S-box-containing protein
MFYCFVGMIFYYFNDHFFFKNLLNLSNNLNEAQSIAKIGNWKFEVNSKSLFWSVENYKIFEIPESLKNQLLYDSFRKRIHPEDLIKLDQLLKNSMDQGINFIANLRLIFAFDRIKYVHLIGKPHYDPNGKLIYLIGTCQDQTEEEIVKIEIENLKLQEELKLREREEVWKLALESAGDGVWDWDISTGDLFFSERWIEILGYNSETVQFNIDEWKKLVHPEDLCLVMESIDKHLSDKAIYQNEHRILCKDGKYKWILDRGQVITYSEEGVPLRMVGTYTDLTAMKIAEHQLIQNSKLTSLGEMSAGMAHEINNPLTIITNSMRLLNRYKENEEKFSGIVQSINKSAERISRIIKGLKKFAHTSEENNYSHHMLANIIKESIVLTAARLKEYNVEIILQLDSDIEIYCDEISIEQVLINLINNSIDAVKFLNEKWIKIELINESDVAVLKVSDSGPRISESIQNKMFDPFFTTKGINEGTGLGLSIIKGILDKHEASIFLDNQTFNTSFLIQFRNLKTMIPPRVNLENSLFN